MIKELMEDLILPAWFRLISQKFRLCFVLLTCNFPLLNFRYKGQKKYAEAASLLYHGALTLKKYDQVKIKFNNSFQNLSF